MFAQRVNKRARSAMVKFLGTHPRYREYMQHDNNYCQRVKLRDLPIPRALVDSAYALLEQDEPFEEMELLFAEFEREHPGVTVGFAGRSNGYIVLYGTNEPEIAIQSPPKTVAIRSLDALQLAAQLIRDSDRHVPTPLESFADWELAELRRVTRLVQDFDSLVDACFDVFLYYAEHYEIVPEVVTFSQTVNVLREKDHV